MLFSSPELREHRGSALDVISTAGVFTAVRSRGSEESPW
uniref:Uncharacterized protein n=1 Tax=Zea mays TaxID=4577 RepID=B6UBF0_MAIZE|nr:hypothetical protein [Zea mays]